MQQISRNPLKRAAAVSARLPVSQLARLLAQLQTRNAKTLPTSNFKRSRIFGRDRNVPLLFYVRKLK